MERATQNDRRKSKISRREKERKRTCTNSSERKKDEKGKKRGRIRKRGKKRKEPRGNPERELAGAYIKGSYRDKGINTSTKCGELDGRSSSKSYLFKVLPLSLSLPFSSHLPHLMLRSLFLSFTPVPSCPSPSTSTVGSSRYSIPVARQRFGGTIPPRQTRLGSILPNERREPEVLFSLWRCEN